MNKTTAVIFIEKKVRPEEAIFNGTLKPITINETVLISASWAISLIQNRTNMPLLY